MTTNIIQANLVGIDQQTRLLKINPETAGIPLEQNEPEKLMVAIIDSSGSMGQNVGRCFRAVGTMAEKLGYTNVYMINFGSTTECKQLHPQRLKESDKSCSGTTRISGTVAEVERVLNSTHNKLVQMIIISDGAVDRDDMPVFMRKVQELPERLQQNNNTIHVIGCRLQTGSYGSPDTRALSGYFNIHNYPGIVPSVLEWVDYKQINSYMTNVTRTFEQHVTVSNYKLSCEQPVLRLKPWEETRDEATLFPGDNIVLIEGTDQIPPLKLNGFDVTLQPAELESEDHLAGFIGELEFKIRNWKVMGGQGCQCPEHSCLHREITEVLRCGEPSKHA